MFDVVQEHSTSQKQWMGCQFDHIKSLELLKKLKSIRKQHVWEDLTFLPFQKSLLLNKGVPMLVWRLPWNSSSWGWFYAIIILVLQWPLEGRCQGTLWRRQLGMTVCLTLSMFMVILIWHPQPRKWQSQMEKSGIFKNPWEKKAVHLVHLWHTWISSTFIYNPNEAWLDLAKRVIVPCNHCDDTYWLGTHWMLMWLQCTSISIPQQFSISDFEVIRSTLCGALAFYFSQINVKSTITY